MFLKSTKVEQQTLSLQTITNNLVYAYNFNYWLGPKRTTDNEIKSTDMESLVQYHHENSESLLLKVEGSNSAVV